MNTYGFCLDVCWGWRCKQVRTSVQEPHTRCPLDNGWTQGHGNRLILGPKPEILWVCPLQAAHISMPRALKMVFWFCSSSLGIPAFKLNSSGKLVPPEAAWSAGSLGANSGSSLLSSQPTPHPCCTCVCFFSPESFLGLNRQKRVDHPIFLGVSRPTETCFCFAFKCVEVSLIYSVALVSVAQQGDSVKHI